jgi:LemA protein
MGPNEVATLIPVVLLVLLPSVWLIGNYNTLVRSSNYCDEAWAQIDTELKRRYDLIPNLVATVKGYAAHERETLERVVELRNRAAASNGTPREQATDENNLVGGLRSLLAVAEAYPELKASAGFLGLQQELSNTEDRIQAARRFYNANVRELNTRIQVVPSNLIAGMFGFKPKEFFEIQNAVERDAPAVKV